MEAKTVRARALIIHNGHVLLIRRIKKGIKFYTFPGGHVEEGESDREGLIREVKEETSLNVVPGEILKEVINRKDDIVRLFRCEVVGAKPETLPEVKMIGEEVDRSTKENQYHLKWVPVESFPKKGVILARNISIMPREVR